MAASFIQQTPAQNGTTTATFPSAVTAGNLIVVSGGISAVSDDLGNTYSLAVASANYTPVAVYYAYNIAGGNPTVTVTLAGFQKWVAEEWTGFGSADPLGGTGFTFGPSVTPVTATPDVGVADGMTVVAAASNDFGWPETASGGVVTTWSERRSGVGAFGTLVASGPITSTGTVTANIAYHGASNDDVVIAYFIDNGNATPDISGSGGVTIGALGLSGIGTAIPPDITGSGGVVIGAPSFSSGLTRLTQMGRNVGTAEDDPEVRLTQLARQVGTAESNPRVRLTQMARQVMYSYTCESEPEPPPITDGPIVHVIIRPQWELERLDVKIRPEERGAKR